MDDRKIYEEQKDNLRHLVEFPTSCGVPLTRHKPLREHGGAVKSRRWRCVFGLGYPSDRPVDAAGLLGQWGTGRASEEGLIVYNNYVISCRGPLRLSTSA